MGSRRARRLAGVHAELDKEDGDEREGKRERERAGWKGEREGGNAKDGVITSERDGEGGERWR